MAAINLEPTDHVPCGVDLSYFVARRCRVTMADFLASTDLQLKLQHRVFEELKGIDYVHPLPSRTVIDQVAGFKNMPMKTRLPGKDLAPDMIPQYEETEVIPEEGYDFVIQNGWERYMREYLAPSVFGDRQEMALSYDEQCDHHFFESGG